MTGMGWASFLPGALPAFPPELLRENSPEEFRWK